MTDLSKIESAIGVALKLSGIKAPLVSCHKHICYIRQENFKASDWKDQMPVKSWQSDLPRLIHRYRWIRRRNHMVAVLKYCGVSICYRCDIANRIMDRFTHRPSLQKRD